jgi:hypothetical protein
VLGEAGGVERLFAGRGVASSNAGRLVREPRVVAGNSGRGPWEIRRSLSDRRGRKERPEELRTLSSSTRFREYERERQTGDV